MSKWQTMTGIYFNSGSRLQKTFKYLSTVYMRHGTWLELTYVKQRVKQIQQNLTYESHLVAYSAKYRSVMQNNNITENSVKRDLACINCSVKTVSITSEWTYRVIPSTVTHQKQSGVARLHKQQAPVPLKMKTFHGTEK